MPAPKKNKFAVGNPGTSKKFTSVKALQREIDKYFKTCDTFAKCTYEFLPDPVTKRLKKTLVKKVIQPLPYTIEGLCLLLGCSRRSLLNYEKTEGYEDYFHTIKNAKLKIQESKVINAFLGETPHQFVQFDLINNHGYQSPTKNVDVKTDGEKINQSPTIQITKDTAKEISDALEDDI